MGALGWKHSALGICYRSRSRDKTCTLSSGVRPDVHRRSACGHCCLRQPNAVCPRIRKSRRQPLLLTRHSGSHTKHAFSRVRPRTLHLLGRCLPRGGSQKSVEHTKRCATSRHHSCGASRRKTHGALEKTLR